MLLIIVASYSHWQDWSTCERATILSCIWMAYISFITSTKDLFVCYRCWKWLPINHLTRHHSNRLSTSWHRKAIVVLLYAWRGRGEWGGVYLIAFYNLTVKRTNFYTLDLQLVTRPRSGAKKKKKTECKNTLCIALHTQWFFYYYLWSAVLQPK